MTPIPSEMKQNFKPCVIVAWYPFICIRFDAPIVLVNCRGPHLPISTEYSITPDLTKFVRVHQLLLCQLFMQKHVPSFKK